MPAMFPRSWASWFQLGVMAVVTLIATLTTARAATVYAYNPIDQPPCRPLEGVGSVEAAIERLRAQLGDRLLVLSQPTRLGNRTMATVELPDRRGAQAYLLMTGSQADCERASRASLVGPGAIPGSGASQPRWVRFAGRAQNRETVYVDVSSVYAEPSGLIRLWVKREFGVDQAVGDEPRHRESVSGHVLDCTAGAVAIVATEWHDADRKVVGQRSTMRTAWQFEVANSESLSAKLLEAHCGRIKP